VLNLDHLRKEAELLVRWHRAGNDSVAGRDHYPHRLPEPDGRRGVGLKPPISEAKEIIALEEGMRAVRRLEIRSFRAAEARPACACGTGAQGSPACAVRFECAVLGCIFHIRRHSSLKDRAILQQPTGELFHGCGLVAIGFP
jgi:hypothetical protein